MSGRAGVTAVAVVAAMGAVAVAAQAAGGGTAVKGRSFTTRAPAHWTVTTVPGPRSLRSYQLASHGRVDALGVPEKGAIATSVYESRLDRSGFRHPDRETADTLAPRLIGIPRGATRITPSSGGHGTLDGERTVYGTYTYTYAGRRIRQRDLVVRYGAYAVVVETIADTSRGTAADRSRSAVQDAWRWR
jgi:hypothetical protein